MYTVYISINLGLQRSELNGQCFQWKISFATAVKPLPNMCEPPQIWSLCASHYPRLSHKTASLWPTFAKFSLLSCFQCQTHMLAPICTSLPCTPTNILSACILESLVTFHKTWPPWHAFSKMIPVQVFRDDSFICLYRYEPPQTLRVYVGYHPASPTFNPSCWTGIYTTFANSVDPDQLASSEANWSGSTLFVIKNLNLYEQLG